MSLAEEYGRRSGRNGATTVTGRSARRTATLAMFVVSALLIACASVSARTAGPSPSRLATRDPGFRQAQNTIVVTGAGATVFGVRRRTNFIAALGSNETVIGGGRSDVLAARGSNVTIRAGNGNAVIFGGPKGRLIGGSGRDLLVATKAEATVVVRGSGSEVVMSGPHDRVVCSAKAHHVLIYRGTSDIVDATCRAAGARVLSAKRLAPGRLATRAMAIIGDGSNASPYTAGCDDPQDVDCTVSAFPKRTLSGGWANEYVPAYGCPGDHPYLVSKGYSPPFTSWGAGVEIQEDDGAFPIGVSITGQKLLQPPLANIFGATLTGYPNSSATNWLWGGSHWYKVVLHCTSDKCHGTDLVGPPPGCGGGAADKPRAVISVARPTTRRLAAQLAARDPGAPVGGNTIAVTGAGARVFGVPRRPNFIIALGANETISGGEKNDQLGALATNVTISGGQGDDVIYGGARGTLIGGPGRDQLIEKSAGGTILSGSGDEVVASGSHDRIVCERGGRHILIRRGATDTISRACRRDRARVLPITHRARLAAAAPIEGNGSNMTPYQTGCTTDQKDSCTVSTFPSRTLDGLWANEFVPAYQCPDDHQYLYFKNYAPAGTTIPHGVEIQQDSQPFQIGITITATVRPRGADLIGRTYGTATGFPNSSATNWGFGKNSYRVVLHCTSFPNLAAMIF